MRKKICMIRQDPLAKGGIAAVVNGYRGSQLEKDFNIIYVESYKDGGNLTKLVKGIRGYFHFTKVLLIDKPDLLPSFKKVTYIKAILSNADVDTEFENWFEALEFMKKQILNQDLYIAIIGAGAYGLPLASFIKEMGKQAIQMAGATQVLFGTIGKMWGCRAKYKELFNEYWTRLDLREIPVGQEKVEGGSCW